MPDPHGLNIFNLGRKVVHLLSPATLPPGPNTNTFPQSDVKPSAYVRLRIILGTSHGEI